jgi:hypothetical protein
MNKNSVDLGARRGVLVGIGALAVLAGVVLARTSTTQEVSETDEANILLALPVLERNAFEEQVQLRNALLNGLNPGEAAFHLVWPSHMREDSWRLLAIEGYLNTSLSARRFVTVDLLDPDAYQRWLGFIPEGTTNQGLFRDESEDVLVSLDRVLAARVASGHRVETAPGEWEIRLTFNQRALNALNALSGQPNPPRAFVDWFGVQRAALEDPTILRVALVVDDTVLTPFLVEGVVAAGAPSTITVATGLSEAQSAEILDICGY